MLGTFINNNSFLESNNKCILETQALCITHLWLFGQIISRLIFLTFLIILIRLSHIMFLKTLYLFFLVGFHQSLIRVT